MSELVKSANFNNIYFRNQIFYQKDIEDAIDHLAKYIQSRLISSSPFIILTAYNHIKTVIAYYAILKVKKIVVILDPGIKNLELTEMITDVDPAAIIFINTVTITWNYEEEILFRKSNKNFIIHSDLKDVCTIAYTNAEDGYSKGAMLTEKNILSEVDALVKTNHLSKKSVTYALLPYYHLFGLIQGILVPTIANNVSVIAEINLYKVNEILKEIKDYKVTHVYSVPSLYYIISKIRDIESYISSVKEFYSGGAKLSSIIFNNFYDKTHYKIREGYGLTETSPGVILNYAEEGPMIESIGKAMPGCNVKILNDIGEECEIGKIGEICIKGDTVFKGYFNHDRATHSVLKNGWLHSGDLGKKDKNENIYFCGLKKEMFNVGGNNIYPKKVERLMLLHPNILSVVVTASDSLIQGHVTKAQIKLKNSSKKYQEQFKNWCFENINNQILPRTWDFE